jgi:hypothetical protein
MSDFKVRGYSLLSASGYLKDIAGDRALAALSPEARDTLATVNNSTWGPAEHLSELLTAVVAVADGNEREARRHLENCGERMGITTTGTFLKLIMKVLTPRLFASRVPQLWNRDSNVGQMDVELFDDHIVIYLKNMEPLKHLAPVIVGYHRFVMRNMGIVITKTDLHGWAIDKPTGKDVWFANYWG